MHGITFLLTTLIAFFGLFAGILIAYHTKDEVHHVKRYLPFLQLLCLVIIFILTFFYYPFFIALVVFLLSFLFMFLFWRRKDINLLDYIVLAVIFAFSSIYVSFHLYITLLLFVFGLFSGTLYYALHTKPKRSHKSRHAHILMIGHHEHSRRHLSFGQSLRGLFDRYYFFVVIAIATYALAHILMLVL